MTVKLSSLDLVCVLDGTMTRLCLEINLEEVLFLNYINQFI